MIEMIRIEIDYNTIIHNKELCYLLWVNPYCVNEWRVSYNDTVSIKIDKYNIRILEIIKNILDE